MRKIVLAAILSSLAFPVWAQTAPPVPVKAPPSTRVASACTTNQCTKWFLGGGLFGAGSNADILGQGLDNSIFANGGFVVGNIGAQYWMNGIFLGAEDIVGFTFGAPATVNTGSASIAGGGINILWLEGGGSLGDIFGSGAAPVTIDNALATDLISLYFGTGPGIAFGNSSLGSATFWTSGAGARYLIPNSTRPLLLDFKYVYGNNNSTNGLVANKNLQLVGATLSIPFNF